MKRLAAVLPAVLAMTVLVAPPAGAGTASVVYSCTEMGSEPVPLTYDVSITAPVKVRKGTKIYLKVSATKPAPADVPAGGIDGDMDVVLGGIGAGTVTATGLANATALSTGQPMVLGPGWASYTPTTTGVVTFAPGHFVMDIWIGATLDCSLPNGGPVLASTTVY